MASFSANFMQQNYLRPSIFELIAQNSMATALRPAINYALQTVAQHYPNFCGWLWRYSEEVYGCLDLLLQSYSLRKFDASFYENFYGLRRYDINAKSVGKPLNTRHRLLSILFLVILPYIKNKLDNYHNDWKDEIGTTTNDIRQQIKKYFLMLYPYIHLIFKSLSLAYNLMYACGIDDSFSPLLKLAGLRLVLLTKEDLEQINSREFVAQQITNEKLSLWRKIIMFISKTFSLILKGLISGLPVLAFCLKTIEWWYSPENTTRSSSAFGELPIPPPPDKPKVSPNGIKPSINPADCALCNQAITNAAALSTSGYVFCYPCIYQYLKEHGKCPITQIATGLQQVVRVYPSVLK